ncbi:ABC transporter substrate-binding protein [Streptomyces mirabilis]|uniref:ABC transporter substrate-binding protein n=1 Tax=Streptomyces mirabilis TaxID=68239 RepID=UPI0036A5ECB3
MTVAVGTSSGALPIYVAMDQGYFAEENLRVQTTTGASASAAIPQLINGQVQFIPSGIANVLQAVQQRLPVVVASSLTVNQTTTDTKFAGFITRSDSPVKSIVDLDGKTLAVNDVSPAGTFLSRAAFEAYGIQNANPKFLEVRPTEAIAAVKKGTADGVLLYQPILQQAMADPKMKAVGFLDGKVLPGLIQTAVITSRSFANDHPEAASGFVKAITKACTYISGHPDNAVRILSDALKRPMNRADLPECPATPMTITDLQNATDTLRTYDVIKTKLDAADFALAGTEK